MYSKDNVPQWASKKSKAVQEVAIRVFNETMRNTKSEEKARIASLAAMKNAEDAEDAEYAEEAEKKKKVLKSVEEILKSKYSK